MPKGPKGEKRPGDVIGAAIMVAKIATGEIEDNIAAPSPSSTKPNRKQGGLARASALTPARRSEIARRAAKSRWSEGAAVGGNSFDKRFDIEVFPTPRSPNSTTCLPRSIVASKTFWSWARRPAKSAVSSKRGPYKKRTD
jgi:hypothetical protein